MHLRDPIAQAILDQPAHDWLVGVQRVAATGIVGVTRFVLLEDVVEVIGEAAIAQRRPTLAAFRGVIEDHIENDFDAGAVECLDHVAKFIEHAEGLLPRTVRMMRREK